MPRIHTHPSAPLLLLFLFLLVSSMTGCAPSPAVNEAQAVQPTRLPSTRQPAETAYLPRLPSPTATPASTQSPDLLSTAPAQLLVEGDEVSVPILLYHHISDAQPKNRYYISPTVFREHMQALHNAGWTAITTAILADMLRGAAPLPEKAVVITFDDGAQDVYENAFPIMQEMGYPGVFFLVSSALGSEGYVSANQAKEMTAAGWEIGSHSMTHADLTKEGVSLYQEMYYSAVQLETALDFPIKSFAYPFAAGSENVYRFVPAYGYTNASCAGWNNRQSARNIFCLSRREVRPGLSAADLLKLVAEP